MAIIKTVTLCIPLSLANVEVPDGSIDEKQEALYAAFQSVYPAFAREIEKTGVITDCSDEDLEE